MWIDLGKIPVLTVFFFRLTNYVSFRESTPRIPTIFEPFSPQVGHFLPSKPRMMIESITFRKPEIYHCLDCHQALSPLYMENPIPLAPLSQQKGESDDDDDDDGDGDGVMMMRSFFVFISCLLCICGFVCLS